MLKRIFRRIMREPVPCVAVIIFTAILSMILCFLHLSQEKEMTDYQEAYASVPVYFSIVNLDGSRFSGDTFIHSGDHIFLFEGIQGWAADLFSKDGHLKPNFSDLVADVHMVMSSDTEINYDSTTNLPLPAVEVVGSTALWLLPELTEDYGGSITWREGYNESFFETEELACIVPEGYTEQETVMINFVYDTYGIQEEVTRTHACAMKVVGTYTGNSTRIYCPYAVMADIYSHLKRPYRLDTIGATLGDNTRLEELRQVAGMWFIAPNETGEPTEWGHYGYDYYPYALDIDDSLLQNLNSTLERSMTVNRLSSLAIFIISAGAGFLVGFLVIRSRKREILLMRTLGSADRDIYREFAVEQQFCAAAGTFLGGSYGLWQPFGQLLLFLAVYFIGLSIALVFFLRRNLLTTIKEDE